MKEITCIGMDGAWTAIDQADAKYPALCWISDTHQSFFLKKEALHEDGILPCNKFDIIIDKGGSTIVADEEEARTLLENIKKSLKKGGMYIYTSFLNLFMKTVVRRISTIPGVKTGSTLQQMLLADTKTSRLVEYIFTYISQFKIAVHPVHSQINNWRGHHEYLY